MNANKNVQTLKTPIVSILSRTPGYCGSFTGSVTIAATLTVLCFENTFSFRRHVVARLLCFHNPHLCSVGDEPTLVSADPQATPLDRNAEPLSLEASHFCKREQIFKLHHIHVKLWGVSTSPIASQETDILSEWFRMCFNGFSSNFSDCEM